ncbi:hypothetical protein [Methanobacterium ferruginis]|uniref:hypothetical protein n=1 Tax=Methanobacterium ferruginis TaxID=710191 RepID=UPI0025733C3C|nr:hypothetical protein [Methanobacterium ferruginis]BDZ68396.1 hypothetical protein GCM10025860_18440 [Methanobacterium ferruginis]
MKFHPVVSIFSGVIISFILFFISALLYGYIWFDLSPIISFIFGGFIAVYFAKEKKIQYALYEGIIVLLIFEFLTNFVASSYFSVYLIYSVLIILLTIIGGMIGLMMDKNYNGFNPFLALFAGSFIGALCIWIASTHGYNPDSVPIDLMDIVIGIIFFMIGGFLSTILAKEKKIQYGIYTGIFILTIIAVKQLLSHQPFVIHILGFIIYLVFAVIGSYLAVVVVNHQKQTSND